MGMSGSGTPPLQAPKQPTLLSMKQTRSVIMFNYTMSDPLSRAAGSYTMHCERSCHNIEASRVLMVQSASSPSVFAKLNLYGGLCSPVQAQVREPLQARGAIAAAAAKPDSDTKLAHRCGLAAPVEAAGSHLRGSTEKARSCLRRANGRSDHTGHEAPVAVMLPWPRWRCGYGYHLPEWTERLCMHCWYWPVPQHFCSLGHAGMPATRNTAACENTTAPSLVVPNYLPLGPSTWLCTARQKK
jgi:hypothetical protein